MNPIQERLLQLLLDERDISRTLIKFSRCIDMKDFEAYAGLYASDGVLRTPWGGHKGREGLADYVRKDIGDYVALHHVSTGHEIDVDGDQASVRATLLATHVTEESGSAFWSVGGHYDMKLRRVEGTWQLSLVELHPVWRFDTPSPTKLEKE
jgi:ketosteroid isomerase-like protein